MAGKVRIMVPDAHSPEQTAGRLFGAAAVLAAIAAATTLLLPNPLADVFFAGWVVASVGFAMLGAAGAWTNRPALTWVAALLLTGLSGIGMTSIGMFIAPAAGLMIGAAVMTQLAGPRTEVREAIRADPPTQQDLIRRLAVGIGAVGIGVGLVYRGAISQELFGACARETLDCAIASSNWGAIAITILGLGGMGVGMWLVWKQLYLARVISGTQPE